MNYKTTATSTTMRTFVSFPFFWSVTEPFCSHLSVFSVTHQQEGQIRFEQVALF